jgi:methyl-accepting chemotaxis protein
MKRQEAKTYKKGWGLRWKLMALLLLVGLIPYLANALLDQYYASAALEDRAQFQLESIRELKKNQVLNYVRERYSDVQMLAEIMQSLHTEALSKIKGFEGNKELSIERFLNKRFADINALASNLGTIAAMQDFATAFKEEGDKVGGSMWNGYKEKYGPMLTNYVKQYGYYDTMLVSVDGDIVYSTTEESDLGQNMVKGTLKDSAVGRLFAKGLKETALEDYAAYAPSGNKQALFIGTPIKIDGKVIGVAITQLSSAEINAIVQEREGLAASFESFIVTGTKDNPKLASDRVVKEGKIGDPKPGKNSELVLSGQTGDMFQVGSTGLFELTTFRPLKVPGVNWGLITTGVLTDVLVPQATGETDDLLTKYQKAYGHYDIYLIDATGYVFYSVKKGKSYHTNIFTGPYKDTNLGKLVRQVADRKEPAMVDHAQYAADENKPVAFLAAPVLEKGELKSIVAVRITNAALQALMDEKTGLGDTGETFLVGTDFLPRTNSRLGLKLFDQDSKLETELVKRTLGED